MILTAGEDIHIQKFALNRSTFVRDCYLFFRELLREITSDLEHSDYDILTAPRSPTIRYPVTPVAPPAELPSYMLMIQTSDFVSYKKTWFSDNLTGIEFEQSLNSAVEHEDWLVLKASAMLLSGGWSNENRLCDFLRMCSNLPKNSIRFDC